MRVFAFIALFITILGSLVYMLLFTSSGNNLLKPYVQKLIEKKINHNIYIESMTLKPDYIDFQIAIAIDKNSTLALNGKINLWRQNFNLAYKINATDLNTSYLSVKNHMSLSGNIDGDLEEYSIDGKGVAFNSNVEFLISLKNKKIKKLKINAKNLKIEDILAFLNKPIYSRGVCGITADLSSVDGKNFDGDIDSRVYFGIIDNQEIKKGLGIALKDTISYKGSVKSKIKDGVIYSAGDIYSNIGQLKLKKSKYNLESKNLSLNYELFLPNLEVLQHTIGKKLRGDIKVVGDLNAKDDDLLLRAQSKNFDGDINLSISNKKSELHFLGLRAQKIEDMFNLKRYANALVDGDIEISNIAKLIYKADIRVYDGVFMTETMQDEFGASFPNNSSFSLHVNSTKQDDKIINDVDFVSNLFSIKSPHLLYDTNTRLYSGNYNLYVNKLENVEFITNTKLRGVFKMDGNFSAVNNDVKIIGESEFLDSNSLITYENGIMDAKVKHISVLRLSHATFLPEIFDSNLDLNATYDINSKVGKFSAYTKDGKFKQSETSDLIFLITKFNLTKHIFANTYLNGTIEDNDLNFTLDMNSKDGYLNIPAGYVNTKDKDINALFKLKIKDKDVNGKITGDIYNPSVKVESSRSLQKRIEKAIQGFF